MYGEGAMIGRNVRKLFQVFKEGRTTVHDEWSEHLSLVVDGLREKLNVEIRENWWFTVYLPQENFGRSVSGVTMRQKICRSDWKAWQWHFYWRHTKAGPMVWQMP
jgi:hypothetical protein